MKAKGQGKRAELPNFWGEFKANIPENVQEFVNEQYLDNECMVIYCDGSMMKDDTRAAVGATYVGSGNINTKGKLLYLDRKLVMNNISVELESIAFALDNFKKYMKPNTKRVLIYSDLNNIEGVLSGETKYKQAELSQLSDKITKKYKQVQREFPDVEVKYLATFYRYGNPFYKSAHNTAKRMLRN